jgi:hypothetical protein
MIRALQAAEKLNVFEGYDLPRRSEHQVVRKPLQIGAALAAEGSFSAYLGDSSLDDTRPHLCFCFVSGHDFSRAVKGLNQVGLYRLRKKSKMGENAYKWEDRKPSPDL